MLVDPSNADHNFKKLSELSAGYSDLAAANGMAEVELNGTRYMAYFWSSDALEWRFIGLFPHSEVMANANSLAWKSLPSRCCWPSSSPYPAGYLPG